MSFNHKEVEAKWIKYWKDNNTFYCDVYDFSKPKYYVLDMFPYPSAQGLHVGHPEGYTATDIVSRMKRMQGFNVLHPMGFDAFGLPSEQYAMKMNQHPEIITYKNIANFKNQITMLGLSYDWSKEIITCDPKYYKWTQWIFLKMFENNLAYVGYKPVNFCPELGCVLANEEVIDGKSERGGYPVIRKPMRQWVLKITDYADQLLEGLDGLDWPKSTLEMQRNWIGKSQGTIVTFSIENSDESFDVFTTRADTLFGCTYCCLAPEHPLVDKITTADHLKEVEAYQKEVALKSDMDRTELNKDKTGVFTGSYAINPINGKKVPIYIADYVLGSYGTGAVMAVPSHDERDYAFAKKYNLDMIQVLEGDISSAAMVEDGKHINSSFADGLNIKDAKKAITDELIKLHKGSYKTNFKLRDWIFSRQRYWGEPIPTVTAPDGTIFALDYDELPLVLPELDEYKPSGTGESPLALAKEWLKYDHNGKVGTRETNTMPQWAGSSWYYIRYLDPHNDKCLADPELIKHWLPVDLYVGGAEHAVLHLLYARFWHKFLFDQGVVACKEPFKKLFHQGMILGSNGEKMSKSCGNVVNPDEIVDEFGADSLRLYEMFMGPLEASLPWSNKGLEGARRFIDRVYRVAELDEFKDKFTNTNDGELDFIYHSTVKKVTSDFEALQFNTAISQMMIFINEVYKANKIYTPYLENFIKMFSCICPFAGEEMWHLLGHNESIAYEKWPECDDTKTVKQTIGIGVQVNGKLRASLEVDANSSEEEIKKLAFENEAVIRHTQGKEILKVIVIKGKIVNIVVK